MSPRSLVGMTQGARKRAARRSLYPAFGLIPEKTARRRHLRCFKMARPGGFVTRDGYDHARKLYRIGERLRPCPWCFGPGDRWNCAARTQQLVPTPSPGSCDGSGVLPAKKR